MNNLISKLNTLKSIEPEENWVVETRKRVLSEAPVLGWKMTEVRNKRENGVADKFFSRRRRDEALPRLYGGYTTLFSKRLAVSAFSLVFLVSGGAFTIEASKSSLPGDPLYIVKIATEDVTLAITSEDKRAEVEMRQVEKRLEEFDKISKNHSDPKQGEKIEMLLGEIEVKTNNSKEYLTKIEDDGVKAKVAKVINIQTEKYAEVLVKTSENLPDVVKDEVSEKLASTIESNEKVNFDSLATRVKLMTDEDKEEIIAIVKGKVEEKAMEKEESIEDAGIEEGFDESNSADQDVVETETEIKVEEESAEDVNNTEESAEESAEESEEAEVAIEDTKKELLEILEIIDDLNGSDAGEGDVNGDSCDFDDAGEEGEGSEDRSEGDGVEGVSDEVEGIEGEENFGFEKIE